jgi:hypothetical protein
MVTVPERLANNGRFELLPVHAGCVAELFEAVAESKNEISRWMEWCDADYSIEATKQWVDSRSQAWEHRGEIRDAYMFSLVPPVGLPGSIHLG